MLYLKIIESVLILILPHATCNPSANSIYYNFKIYPQVVYFLPPPQWPSSLDNHHSHNNWPPCFHLCHSTVTSLQNSQSRWSFWNENQIMSLPCCQCFGHFPSTFIKPGSSPWPTPWHASWTHLLAFSFSSICPSYMDMSVTLWGCQSTSYPRTLEHFLPSDWSNSPQNFSKVQSFSIQTST